MGAWGYGIRQDDLVWMADPRLKTDVGNARIPGSLVRHGLAAWR